METPRKFIIAKLSIHKLWSLSVLIMPLITGIISTDERPSALQYNKFTWCFHKAKLVTKLK